MYALTGRSGRAMGKRNTGLCRDITLCVAIFFCMGAWFCQGAWAQERRCITSKIANVRSGPGTNYETLWQVETYYPILIVEKKDSWLKFKDFEGDMGWIHGSLVGDAPSVITVKSNCNVRSGPGPVHPIVFTVERGVPFKVLKQQSDWLEVEHGDGDRGWIYKPLVW
ncbi:SH3 domain-containing protein [Desulforapulum autotrophicum]|nr:SH3 domain-containing protein [Desulforapulum autotrophicum]